MSSPSEVHSQFSKYRSKKKFLEDVLSSLALARPADSEALNFSGAVARSIGDPRSARLLWETASRLDANNSNVLCNLSLWFRESNDLQRSLDYALAARTVDPSAKTWNLLGVTYYNLRQPSNAVQAYRQAIKLDETLPEAWANLGNALKDLHQSVESDQAFDKCLSLNPNYAWAMGCQAYVKQRLAKRDEACELIERALSLDKDNAELWLSSLMVRLPLRPKSEADGQRNLQDFGKQIQRITDWTKAKPDNLKKLGQRVGYSQPYYIAYRDGNHRDTLGLYGALMADAVEAYRPNQVQVTCKRWDGVRRLRMAVVTGFFFRHSAWDVILKGLVLNLDRELFELELFYTGTIIDDQTDLAKSNCDRFVQGPMTHQAWVDLVSEGQFDVILYPEVGMDPFSMHLACMRLAPLQMSSWGHPMTSGLPHMDWFLSGELLESSDGDDHYTERLVRLPGTGVCTTKLELQPKRVVLKFPGDAGSGGRTRLYLCQHAFKYTESAIKLIADIASEVSGADLILVRDTKYPEAFQSAVDALKVEFLSRGIDFEGRVLLLPWMTREQFLGSFHVLDIYLDLPGFSGYTTAWQALSQGIPVVTLEGTYLRQRLAAGLLKKIKSEQYIAKDISEYVGIVKELSELHLNDAVKWAALRAEIVEKYKNIDDDRAPIRELERLIRNHFQTEKTTPRSPLTRGADAANKPSAIIVTQLSDVDVLAKDTSLANGRKLVFFDSFIFENAHLKGIPGCEIKRLKISPDDLAKNVSESLSRAKLVDLELSRLREQLFNDIPHPGWDAELFSTFFWRALAAKTYARGISDWTDDYSKLSILSPSFPMELYFDSAITSGILNGSLPELDVLQTYSTGRQWRDDYHRWTFDFDEIRKRSQAGEIDALVHIPTCFHDVNFFKKYLTERFPRLYELPSLLWDVPIKRKEKVTLQDWTKLVNRRQLGVVKEYSRHGDEIIRKSIGDVLGSERLIDLQAKYLAYRLEQQAATYLLLKQHLQGSPEFVTSCHNVGLNGPIFSAARRLGSNITVLPHSSVTKRASLMPHAKGVLLLQGKGYRSHPLTVLGESIQVEERDELSQFCKYKARKEIKTVCLLLNSLYGSGISHEDIFELRTLYRGLRSACEEVGVRLVVRAKPSGTAPMLLSKILEVPVEQLAEWTKMPMAAIVGMSDACLMYGEPTSGLNYFLSSGVLTFATWNQTMPREFFGGEYLRDGLVPLVELDGVVDKLAQLFADKSAFRKELDRQKKRFAEYAN